MVGTNSFSSFEEFLYVPKQILQVKEMGGVFVQSHKDTY